MTPSPNCIFCDRIARGEALIADEAAAFPDAFPVSPEHTLIVPIRHEPDFFALTEKERDAMLKLVVRIRNRIQEKSQPDGFNIGINIGESAGQTIAHAHIHVIPRVSGDVSDPRGGVRWVLPARAKY